MVNVDGYKWFGKGGVGFLVCECIVEEVEFIRDVKYELETGSGYIVR